MDLDAKRIGEARAVLIAGPTASGKSALALDLVEKLTRAGQPAAIVNADSMQVYSVLRILTARPDAGEMARAPHHLYGHVPAQERYSAGRWLDDVRGVLAGLEAAGHLPVLVGGTGLYFSALTQGLAALPDIPAAIRQHWQAEMVTQGPAALHRLLAERDTAAAAAIGPGDRQRIVRALEVQEATGRSILAWQDVEAEPPLIDPAVTLRFVVEPDRAALYAAIERRFDAMVGAGALDEVAGLLALDLDPDLPVMKAIGVKAFADFLGKRIPLAQAIARAKTQSRQYAKRQMTWFRNQMADWERLDPHEGDRRKRR
jgi:tRNA dimethylallyltransferase